MAARVVLITGASSGIGRACADRLHASGWTVVGISRTITRSGARPPFVAIDADVTREADVVAVLAQIERDHGRLDAVVNCAGYALAGPVEETPREAAERQFDTNFHGLAAVCRLAARTLRAQGHGHIVNVGSIAGQVPMAFQAYYSSSKAAVAAFTHALRLELRPYGVHTVLVEPGDVSTPFTAARQLASPAGASHYPAFARTLAVIHRDETAAGPPEAVAVLVAQVLESPTPRAVVWAGPWHQRLGAAVRPIVPTRVFDWVLRKLYALDVA